MELGLGGKIAIVTGGSKGIGRATAIGIAAEGGSVLACARGKEALDETVALARRNESGRVETFQADLTRVDDVKRVVARCIDMFGRVDLLVNNAGSARPGEFLKITDDEWLEDWTLKFFGYVRMAREVFPHMQRQKGGVIVNLIGTGGLRPSGGYMVGGAANAALNHFTKALADEGAKHRVRVVGVNPGPILTDRLRLFTERAARGRDLNDVLARMTPLGRAGNPEEVADLVMFLASERAAFIHGANITIDGGANPGLIG
ncbi:MAG TPA: SDR family oxidoreductase [Candidatus Acidoferrales bacterium]|nr:SDR family oxidoreductase [Candidatus Acidoferrales bacterium]